MSLGAWFDVGEVAGARFLAQATASFGTYEIRTPPYALLGGRAYAAASSELLDELQVEQLLSASSSSPSILDLELPAVPQVDVPATSSDCKLLDRDTFVLDSDAGDGEGEDDEFLSFVGERGTRDDAADA